jgi:predicted alpha-1,2-mannosidase
MISWSPETSRGDHQKTAAPGGYHYDAPLIRGFSLTHLSGTGCRGASGDIPILPFTKPMTISPAVDRGDTIYASSFRHDHERAQAGRYEVELDNGVHVDLAVTLRSGAGTFAFPPGVTPTMLFRTSDSQLGSEAASTTIDPEKKTISGMVRSGNFCGYLDKITRKGYYNLYFVAQFDEDFASYGTWSDDRLVAHSRTSQGATGWDEHGFARINKGSGAYVTFAGVGDAVATKGKTVQMRVGISYVSLEGAKANLEAENPMHVTAEALAKQGREKWNHHLSRIRIHGGTKAERRTFYTALYHALLHPNVFSDNGGEYVGFDGRNHRVEGGHTAHYANFSGWDVYRSQVQLLAWLFPEVASDIAHSLFLQAKQNGGKWDRWTHNNGETHVMNGDPSAAAMAAMVAFGAQEFDQREAFDSLWKSASVVHAQDRKDEGCPVMCAGQRPSLSQWMKLGYVPQGTPAWGSAADSLEYATADFALSQWANAIGRTDVAIILGHRASQWKNLFNIKASAHGGYIQERRADGTWPAFDPASEDGFVEGSAAQYLWMVPFDGNGLVAQLGGKVQASARLDAFFRGPDGRFALTQAGPLHAAMDNEPSIASPWIYAWTGEPYKTQETVHAVLSALWSDRPEGIPGNDDLGQMSSWYVWTAMGLYPAIPGRAELLITAPIFSRVDVQRPGGNLTIVRTGPQREAPYVQELKFDRQRVGHAWLDANQSREGGRLDVRVGKTPDRQWGASAATFPPSLSAPSVDTH